MQKKKWLIFFFSTAALHAFTQNVSSPYSILGIGDIESSDFGRYDASGSASVSRRDVSFYNYSNPASLTAMPYKAVSFDLALRGKASRFQLPGQDTLTSTSKDFVMKRVSLACKLTADAAVAFGLKPFSSVNYQDAVIENVADGNAQVAKYTDGSGGINQVYFSMAKQLRKNLSVGITASWLFGALQRDTRYYNPLLGLDITRSENNFYNAAGLQMGIQYYPVSHGSWQQQAGVTISGFTKLKGQNTTEYTESSTVIETTDPVNISFRLPLTVAAGYSIANIHGLSFHLQGIYNKWQTQKVDYRKSYTKDAYAFNAGFEYSKKTSVQGYQKEKYFIGGGFKMEQSYLVVNNKHINDMAVTFGGGKNITKIFSVNASAQIGSRGSVSNGQIREQYFQFTTGLSLKGFWFGTKKFGRYD